MLELEHAIPEGCEWNEGGWSTLRGNAQRLYGAIDAMFLRMALSRGAHEVEVPICCAAEELSDSGAREAFPHLLVNLGDEAGDLRMAACPAVFHLRRGEALERAERWTLRADCMRREDELQPLRRQMHFRMREIVVLGSATEVGNILCGYESELQRLFQELGLRGKWENASDPFFAGALSGAAILQRAEGLKREYRWNGLALASINRHGNALGKRFGIRSKRGPAHSLCIAFGLERWLLALHEEYGPEPRDWPRPLRRELRDV